MVAHGFFTRVVRQSCKMQIIKNRERIGAITFQIGFIIELLIMITDHAATWTIPYRGRLAQIAFVMFCIKILTTYYYPKQWVWIVLLGIIGTISYFACQDEYVLRLTVMVIAAKGEDINNMARITLFALSVATILIIILSLFGIGGKVVDIREYRYGIVESRYCLGFNHANNVHSVFWYIVALFLCVSEGRYEKSKYWMLTLVNALLFILTKSRTGIIAIQLLILLCFLSSRIGIKKAIKGYYALALISLVASLALSYYSGIRNVYSNKLYWLLDRVFSGRMEMVWEYAPVSEWHMFSPARTAPLVDNGFVKVAYIYGIIPLILYCIMIVALLISCIRNEKVIMLLIVWISIFVTLMEGSFVINTSLVCVPILVYTPIIWGNSDE